MRGDYYRGDYYRGDPGPFSFIEKAVKGVARAVVPGFSAAEGVVRSLTRSSQPAFKPAISPGHPVAAPEIGNMLAGAMQLTPAAIAKRLLLGPSQASPDGACPKGFRPNKSDYFLKDGTFVAAGSRCVRFRSMNPLNHRALKRGVRRAEGFVRIARRTLTATTLPKRGGGKFKRRKR
jgi:hypothetical protein